MALRVSADPGPAAWLTSTGVRWDRLVTFGPDVFPAYARVRFIPDPTVAGQRESDVELPDVHPSDLRQSRVALEVLAAFTGTPDDCWFCLWEGYPDQAIPRGLPESALVVVPHRRYALLHGAIADLEDWRADSGSTAEVGPAFVWPEDRSWVFASDVDPHWAGVGGSADAIEALLREPGLDVVPADPAARHPGYG